MNRTQAMTLFNALEERRGLDSDADFQPPTYDVRLDAISTVDDNERRFRIRVTAGRGTGGIYADHWRFVLDQADGDVDVDIQNSGIELS